MDNIKKGKKDLCIKCKHKRSSHKRDKCFHTEDVGHCQCKEFKEII